MDSPLSRRSLVGLAKRGLARCQRRIAVVANKLHRHLEPVRLDEPVLEAIFSKLPLDDRMRMGLLSHRTENLVDRMPLIIPFLMIRVDKTGSFELFSDSLELIAGHILSDCPGCTVSSEKIVFNQTFSHIVINRLLARISGICQFWLETESNAHIAQLIVDYYLNLNENGNRKRFHIEQLTVVGSGRSHEMDAITSLIQLARKNIQAVRFRHCRATNEEESVRLWSVISQCYSLHQIQYEPCKVDRWSRKYIVEALEKKELSSIIITGVADLQPSDLFRVADSSCLVELAVVADMLPPTVYTHPKAARILSKLQSLLIQLDSGFSVEDSLTRTALLQILESLPSSGVLEVIHINRGTVSDTARVLSYWLHLAKDSARNIKLKLEDCSQERQDAAVGRLMRKSREATKAGWFANGLILTSGAGQVVLLDKHTWFGDEE